MYKKILKPVLFLFDPETIHHLVFFILKFIFKIPGFSKLIRKHYSMKTPLLSGNVFGIQFPNPVGLAAGFDKNGKMIQELSSFGFGFIEIGTVTPQPQEGNPRPRMFRLKKDDALINRMGFNNDGAAEIAKRLRRTKQGIVIGGNIGKNKSTPNEQAIDDYEKCFRELFDMVNYFVVNVSSPNTPGLRELQEKEPLKKILLRLQEVNSELAGVNSKSRKPILLKIAPDLTNEQLNDILLIITETCLDGIVATNTTISRAGLKTPEGMLQSIGNGGLSGKPLRHRATEIISYLNKKSNGKIIIIGAGGIHSPEDAIEKLNAGATLIQLYTGFIYEGPDLVKRINKSLSKLKM